MLFSSVTFLFFFLPATLLSYYMVRHRGWRNGVLTFFSLVFYGWGGLQGLSVMLVSVFFNWLVALIIDRNRDKPVLLKLILAFMVAVNLAIIGYFKYAAFFVNNFAHLFGLPDMLDRVLMPIGISFFTFQAMSYVLDVYFQKGKVQKNVTHVALYIALFPQLVAGPIVRYQTVSDAITDRKETLADFTAGVRRFIYGFAKKLLLANAVGQIATDIFAFEAGYLSTLGTWVGALAYTLQIYLDFSAYSDMAIGLGLMFGFHFDENFNYPYISKSITEFWRRWHISLSTWFRDYLYIPLGGSRVSAARHVFNLSVVWLLTGLWHGAEWTFIAWGAYYGVLLLLEKYVFGGLLDRLPGLVRHALVMFLVIIGWVLFRSDTLAYAWDYIRAMFGVGMSGLVNNQGMFYIVHYPLVWIACIMAAFPLKIPAGRLISHLRGKSAAMRGLCNVAIIVWELGIFILSVIEVINTTFNPFIYFRF